MKHTIATFLGLALVAGAALSAPGDEEQTAVDSDTAAAPADEAEADGPVDAEIPVALLIDQTSGQTLYSREPDRRFVPASVTKVMTVYTAFDLISRGKLSLDRVVLIDKDLEDEWGGEGSTLFLKAGDRLTVGELLLGITTVSANDGAVALGRAAVGSDAEWLRLMNSNAASLGMRDSHFGSPNGYPDEGRTWTSAHDLAALAEALTTRFPGLYKRYFGHKGLSYHNIAQANHDPITGVVKGADGIKTGYTRQAGYNFVGSAERDGRRLTLVIAGAPTANIRNRAARKLMEWGYDNFSSRRLLFADTPAGEIAVQGGSELSVPLKTQSAVFVNLPRGDDKDVSLSVRYRGPVEAPVKEGDRLASLRVSVAGQQPHDVPLVAARSVGKANAIERLRNGIVGLVR